MIPTRHITHSRRAKDTKNPSGRDGRGSNDLRCSPAQTRSPDLGRASSLGRSRSWQMVRAIARFSRGRHRLARNRAFQRPPSPAAFSRNRRRRRADGLDLVAGCLGHITRARRVKGRQRHPVPNSQPARLQMCRSQGQVASRQDPCLVGSCNRSGSYLRGFPSS
jgi:hypothetical protein